MGGFDLGLPKICGSRKKPVLGRTFIFHRSESLLFGNRCYGLKFHLNSAVLPLILGKTALGTINKQNVTEHKR
jgi:hypothetical protein